MQPVQSEETIYIALANHRARLRPFGITRTALQSHLYVLGRTGTGKSTLLRLLAAQDALSGGGLALFDPHGDLAESLARLVPGERLVCLHGARADWGFNPLRASNGVDRGLLAAGLVDVFKKAWTDSWGPRLEHLLRNVVLTLLEAPRSTLGHVPRLLADRAWRRQWVSRLTDPVVQDFWRSEYDRYSPGFRAVVTAPLQNKLGALLTDHRLRAILTSETTFDLGAVMDEGRVLLVNLSKGQMGEGPSSLLGSLLVSHVALQGLSRASIPEDERRHFTVFADEFQTFSTGMLATMLSELRKYRVGLVLANQYLAQLDADVRDAVLGNVGTLVAFRLGAQDASFMEREFAPVFSATDLLSLPNHHVYLKLLIGGQVSRPFSAQTFGSLRDLPGYDQPA